MTLVYNPDLPAVLAAYEQIFRHQNKCCRENVDAANHRRKILPRIHNEFSARKMRLKGMVNEARERRISQKMEYYFRT